MRFSEGSVDYVFFAVLKNARTAQFEEVKIVDHMPRKQKEWKALVVVEAKVRTDPLQCLPSANELTYGLNHKLSEIWNNIS